MTSRPLMELRPGPCRRLPWVALAALPTPVERWERLSAEIRGAPLHVKRDDRTSAAYGGNKVRKLEWLLGAARARQATTVLTFGFRGSHHVAATAIHARRLGMATVGLVLPRPWSLHAERQEALACAAGATVRRYSGLPTLVAGAIATIGRTAVDTGRSPYVIAPGGSSPLGVLGYVDAALELDRQVRSGETELPERIYVALGSLGTSVGLALGMALSGRATRVVAVRVVDPAFADRTGAERLARRTVRLLEGRARPSLLADALALLEIREGHLGPGYARPTAAGLAAARQVQEIEGLTLDPTYTAKTCAAMLADATRADAHGPMLLWNTYAGPVPMPESPAVDASASHSPGSRSPDVP